MVVVTFEYASLVLAQMEGRMKRIADRNDFSEYLPLCY